MKFKQIALTKG